MLTVLKISRKKLVKLCFINSCKFLASNLEKLTSYLDKDKLKITWSEFLNLSAEDFDLLTRKNFRTSTLIALKSWRKPNYHRVILFIVLYWWHDIWERLRTRRQRVATVLHSNARWYSDLYLNTDVLLLADIFENFRDNCVASYGLDPAYYYTLPGFTWDAILKYTGVQFKFTDIDMVMFVKCSIREGLSQCSKRYTQANNKYMQSIHRNHRCILYISTLTTCTVGQYANYCRWVDDVENFNVMDVALDSSR